ncbi:D-alanyl-D-alanine carboxypeptidase [Chelativorans sp. ZYF759]|uniref:D-alanyl-D-alanine carboxypeptidase n=1 Tax=Chelativorans sp. ZYF759 TaxID=2692213 RepID=UPI00145DBA67|nr:D-alanyl-D-alanine carboxypeptidase [Chelativorans sp. ZYF759]NMG41243.1 D-alanyl-D-alanine carboxypeptidase [Chelativorans sp. ZYF759]
MRRTSAFFAVQKPFRQKSLVTLVIALMLAFSLAGTASANPRYAAYVLDTNTGQVLFSRNADAQRFPASLTKVMTIYLLFEAMETGRISKSTPIPMSRNAAAEPPTKLGIRPGSTITVDNAIKALVTRSANDVATAVGEFLGGSEANFARMMTAKARQLGMNSTTFQNAHGLPNNRQVTTARDMAILGLAVREHFPDLYPYFSTRQFNFAGQTIGNHNRLLGRVTGVDGIKTGFIRASGFNLVTSVRTGGRSIVAVVMGGQSGASRDNHMAALIQEHLPRASTNRPSQPLVARGTPLTSSVNVVSVMPERMAVPQFRPRQAAVAAAYAPEQSAPRPVVAAAAPVVASAAPAQRPAEGASAASTQTAYAAPSANRFAPPMPVGNPVREQASAAAANPGVDTMTTNSTRPTGGWAVQVGSLGSEQEAQAFLMRIAKEAGGILSNASGFTEPFTRNGTNYVRARFGGFQSSKEAWDACNALKGKRVDCFAAEL